MRNDSIQQPFLTRPYWNWHSLNSYFDHCNPDYSVDGRLCIVDGTVALKSNGYDPSFPKGYAVTPGGTDYIYYDGHNGYDLGLWYEEVLAAAPGTVTVAGIDPVPYNACFGNTVVIDHGNGFSTRYAHLSEIDVSVGQSVYRGERIGISGTSGCSTGPHLHFGVYVNNGWEAIDAWGWLGAPGADPWPFDAGDLWITGNPQNPVPTAPSTPTAAIVGQSVQVSWSPPSFDGGSGIASYTVVANPGGAAVTVPGTTTQALVNGLTPGTNYTFTVTAASGAGSGPASAASNSVFVTQQTLQAVLPTLSNGAYGGYTTRAYVENLGSTPAAVTIQYHDQTGQAAGSGDSNPSLAPHALWEVRQDDGNGLPVGGAGSGFVYSTQPVAVFANEFGPTAEASSYTALPASGASTLYAPSITQNGYGGYTTGIGLVNLGAAPVSPTITYRDPSGAVVKTQSLGSVPAGGYVGAYSGKTTGGLATDAGLPDGFVGTATIAAPGGQLAATVNEVGAGGAFGSYDAVAAGAANLFMPVILNGGYGGYYTGIDVQNTTGTAGTVTVTYYDAQGAQVGSAVSNAIAPNGHLALYSGDPSAGPPRSATGYTARLSATVPLAAITNEGNGSWLSSYNAFPGVAGGQALPLVENVGSDGWSAGLNVMNTGSSSATVTVTFYGDISGAQIGQTSATLAPGAFWGLYTPTLGMPPVGGRATASLSASSGAIAVVCNLAGPGEFMSYSGQ